MSIGECVFLIALVCYFIDTSIRVFNLDSEVYKIQMKVIERDKEIKEIEKKLKNIYDSIKDEEE